MPTLPLPSGHLPRPGSGSWLASRSDGHRLHAGVDLLGPVGSPVVAPEDGTVVVVASASTPSDATRRSAPAGWAGYGPRAVLIHGLSGTYHLLAHLRDGGMTLATGAHVREGQQVGEIGVTSTPHLHWEVRTLPQPPSGVATVEVCGDPAEWLAGVWSPWDGRCPPEPANDVRTPRACRPGWRGPAPDPFPRPRPEAVAVATLARWLNVRGLEMEQEAEYGSSRS